MTKGWGNTSKQFAEALVSAGVIMTASVRESMRNASKEWISHIDGSWPHSSGAKNPDYPWWSGTTHDSVSIRVTEGSRTIAVEFMPRAATSSQKYTEEDGASRDYSDITGWQFGRLAYGRSARYSTRELAAWLVIGVPYAEALNTGEMQNGKYEEFADRMFDDLLDYMRTALLAVTQKSITV